MQLFAFNLEKFTQDRFFYTGTARGARDKYEVWYKPEALASLWGASTSRVAGRKHWQFYPLDSSYIDKTPDQRHFEFHPLASSSMGKTVVAQVQLVQKPWPTEPSIFSESWQFLTVAFGWTT